MRGIFYRICLMILNMIFPPATVMILTGLGTDTLINCCFFILAVIPAHVHGFYISCVYLSRRHKVKKGRYPGGPKSMIYSRYVINGGASDQEVNRLYLASKGGARRRSRSRDSRSDGRRRERSRESNGRARSAHSVKGDVRRERSTASQRRLEGRQRHLSVSPARPQMYQRDQFLERDGYGMQGVERAGR